ncbi:Asp/Glu/hydantoin racemase [Tepidamorphus gemmatus]|uniref:Asp/Glu/hydantoin racemase n=1 Tax=Tepidamorphus gemmatus TaxID=747076 RepID=A0A4R3M4Z1_9HYPH|nr:aspartate/glutamate racemase family protein [Tepidamorphus gemmatus]TCT08424.1 Asp/Glu/hydantoin racemase [Tepidamorphus gemmatus]
MRIWHQSYTDLNRLPGYAAMLARHARAVCGPQTEVELHGLRPGTYPDGVPPVAIAGYPYARRLADLQVVENVMTAERLGYDAVAISCFLDPGLEEARSLVDIPVLSSCETALLIASTVARSFGLLTLDAAMAAHLRHLIARYGFAGRVAVVAPLDPPLDEFELDQAFAGSAAFVDRFSAQAGNLIAAGADIIIPAEGVLNVALVRNRVTTIAGAPVLDSYGALLTLAEAMVRLRRTSGLTVSRVGEFARPPADIVNGLRGIVADIMSANEGPTPR